MQYRQVWSKGPAGLAFGVSTSLTETPRFEHERTAVDNVAGMPGQEQVVVKGFQA